MLTDTDVELFLDKLEQDAGYRPSGFENYPRQLVLRTSGTGCIATSMYLTVKGIDHVKEDRMECCQAHELDDQDLDGNHFQIVLWIGLDMYTRVYNLSHDLS